MASEECECGPVGMYELIEAVEGAIKSADAEKRAELSAVMRNYMEEFPDEFLWAIGAQAPTLLSHLMTAIDVASELKGMPKGHVINRVPQGHA